MARPPPQSFLLRLWREQEAAPLRATLITVAEPADARHFATLEALHAYLHIQAGEAPAERSDHSIDHCTPSERPHNRSTPS